MDTQLLLKTAMLAGEIMLRSGAETYRVEDTMHHILKTADHIEMAEVLVIMTGISAPLRSIISPASIAVFSNNCVSMTFSLSLFRIYNCHDTISYSKNQPKFFRTQTVQSLLLQREKKNGIPI